MKNIVSKIIVIFFISLFLSCDKKILNNTNNNKPIDNFEPNIKEEDRKTSYSDSDLVITFNNSEINLSYKTNNVSLDNNEVRINSGGTYILKGTSINAKVFVELDEEVHLILDNVNLKSNEGAPIVIMGKTKKIITVKDNTINYLEDSTVYSNFFDIEKTEPNGVVFSKRDLTINGNGTLIIKGNYNNGISTQGDLLILNSKIDVSTINNGIKGNNSVTIENADIKITSNGDSIKSDKPTNTTGYINIIDSMINITSKEDAIDAHSHLKIKGGNINLNTIEPLDYDPELNSLKGLKSDIDIIIESGIFNINSVDDGIHAANIIKINGGTIDIITGDDGIHSDKTLEINNGKINIKNCFEGLEAAEIIINNGDININSSNDAINSTDRTVVDNKLPNENCFVIINGGNLAINSYGDGIDSNGTITINGGSIFLDGPSDIKYGTLDSNSGISLNGGLIFGSGQINTEEKPSNNSSQNTVVITFSSLQDANSKVVIKDSNNKVLVEYNFSKDFQYIIFSSNSLEMNLNYKLFIDDNEVQSFKVIDKISEIK